MPTKLKPEFRIYQSPYEVAEKLAETIVANINKAAGDGSTYSIALSGGSTPSLLFSVLGDHYSASAKWEAAHFFWGDERCVEPDNSESNYLSARKGLFDKILIPEYNIHRVRGEEDPEKEAERYSMEIIRHVRLRNGYPSFDLMILGMGEDGHTASIFPGREDLLDSSSICSATVHPVSRQRRITLTGRVINNSSEIVFLVTGEKKSALIKQIRDMESGTVSFPAAHIMANGGSVVWMIDKEAGKLL